MQTPHKIPFEWRIAAKLHFWDGQPPTELHVHKRQPRTGLKNNQLQPAPQKYNALPSKTPIFFIWDSPYYHQILTLEAASWQNQQNGMCAQRRLTSGQSDQSSLSAWRKLESLATHWAHSEDSDQTGRMPRLIWVFAGHTCHFVGFVMRWLFSVSLLSWHLYVMALPLHKHLGQKIGVCFRFPLSYLDFCSDPKHFIEKTD